MTGDVLLDLRDLHVWFDLDRGGELHAVRGVSLRLDRGERRPRFRFMLRSVTR